MTRYATTHSELPIGPPVGPRPNIDEDRNVARMEGISRVIVKKFSVIIVDKLFFIFFIPQFKEVVPDWP